jgi:hypothetical protein
MAFDRSKFKAAPMSAIETQEAKAKKASKSFNQGGRVSFHKVEDGSNWFRVAPAHNSADSPYVPIRATFLNCEVDVYEDGEPTGVKEVKPKSVFIATQHHDKITKDPIETYVDYVYKRANEEFHDKEDRQKFLYPITGFKAKGKWNPGIRPSTNWQCYAWDKSGTLGRLQLYDNWMKELRDVSARESDDAVISVDIFSDPDEGYPLLIEKAKEKDKWKYTIVNESLKKGEDWDDFFKRNRVSDAQLLELTEQKSLKELLVNVYSMRDFDLALDGLKRFDDKEKYGIFENDDFLNEIEEIHAQIEALGEPKEDEKPKTSSKKIEPKEDEEEISPIKMKKFLREYIEENYGEDFELPNIKGTELKEWYDLAKEGEELPFTEDEKNSGGSESEVADEITEDELQAQLAALKSRRKK